MTRDEFRQFFESALDTAARNADELLSQSVPRNFKILLHGAGHSGDLLDAAAAVDALYLGRDIFYLIIDFAIVEVHTQFTVVFVRASGHTPGPFDQTWNDPPGSGPFKQIFARDIRVVTD
jgi:hypothetical protein